MVLMIVGFATLATASAATLAGVWLLNRTGQPIWAGAVLTIALILDGGAYASGLQMPIVTSALLVSICIGVGTLAGWWIEERATLVAALLGAAFADLVSTLSPIGFTRRIMEDAARGGRLLGYLTVSVPYEGGILHVIGFADLALLAIAILGLRNLGAGWPSAFGIPFAGFVIAFSLSLVVGWAPGLPFLAATTLLYLYLEPARRLIQIN